MGIGSGGNNDHGDVSWKQNRDYELMLKRLNTTTTSAGGDEGEDEDEDEDEERVRVVSMVPDGFVRAGAGAGEGAEVSKVMDGKAATDVSIQGVDEDEEERKRLRKGRKQRRKERRPLRRRRKRRPLLKTMECHWASLLFLQSRIRIPHRPYYHHHNYNQRHQPQQSPQGD